MNLPFLFSASALVIVIFSFFYFKSYLKRRTSQKRILSEFQEEVNKILRSINETTERDISLIEGRENDLRNLLEEIEKRLKTYVREMERATKAENFRAAFSQTIPIPAVPTEPQPKTEGRPVADPKSQLADGTYQELGKKRYKLNRQGISQTGEGEQLAESGPAFPLPDFNVKTETNTSPAPSMGEQIRSLLLSGFSAPVVASRLGLSIAEVELTAALLERRGNG